MKKNTGPVTLYWYGASGDVLTETSSNGSLVSDYIFFNGKRVARRDADSSVHYYFSDNLGSASVITDSQGNITEESDYYPYGGEIAITNGDPNHYKFTGKERDSESGLDNFGARYDASSMGRFMTPDSIAYSGLDDPQSLNLYSYVGNHPTSMIDPDGHCWQWAQWICDQAHNVGQRFDNLFHGEGFHTDKGMEDIAHRNNAGRRQQEVSGQQTLGTRYANFHKSWDRWWAAHDCEGSKGGCGLAPSLASLGVYIRPTRTLFRAVNRAEFENIQKTGKFKPSPGGAEHKYFYPTLEQAEKMGERSYPGNYGIVSGTFPESAVEGPTGLATEGDVFVVPNENLEMAEPKVELPIPEVPE